MSKLFIFDAVTLNKKNEKCDQRDINISDQFETLIPCSTIHFLGMRARFLQKLAIGNLL